MTLPTDLISSTSAAASIPPAGVAPITLMRWCDELGVPLHRVGRRIYISESQIKRIIDAKVEVIQ